MYEEEIVTGIVLYGSDLKEYDRRLVILTKERGKITVFANGARRMNSRFLAATRSYAMGSFTVRPGRDSYTLIKAEITERFSELEADIEKLCYAAYFCEFMSYYTREGDFCVNHLNLLYTALKALIAGHQSLSLIKNIYELRLMALEGQGLYADHCVMCGAKNAPFYHGEKGGMLCDDCAKKTPGGRRLSETVIYTLSYIAASSFEKLFSFNLREEAEAELSAVVEDFRGRYVGRQFNSLEILKGL